MTIRTNTRRSRAPSAAAYARRDRARPATRRTRADIELPAWLCRPSMWILILVVLGILGGVWISFSSGSTEVRAGAPVAIGKPGASQLPIAGKSTNTPGASVFFIDLTDARLPRSEQLTQILDEIDAKTKAIRVGDRLAIVILKAEGAGKRSNRTIIFDALKPKTKDECTALTEPCVLIAQAFERQWRAPLAAVLEALRNDAHQEAATSPIMSTLAWIAGAYRAVKTEIIVYSDLEEHSDLASVYQKNCPTFDQIKARQPKVLETSFANISVTVRQFATPDSDKAAIARATCAKALLIGYLNNQSATITYSNL
jgi:hypothetical protein